MIARGFIIIIIVTKKITIKIVFVIEISVYFDSGLMIDSRYHSNSIQFIILNFTERASCNQARRVAKCQGKKNYELLCHDHDKRHPNSTHDSTIIENM